MSDTTNNAVQLLNARLAEIDEERAQLNEAIEALTGTTEQQPKSQPKSTKSRKGQKSSKGASRKNGGRSADVLRLVTETPGITRKDLAKVLGTRPNYVYRVTNAMVAAGQLVLDGKGLTVVTEQPKPKRTRSRKAKAAK